MAGHKADWRLIPRDEEEKYLNWKPVQPFCHKEISRTMPFPPLLREMILREMKLAGKSVDQEPMLPIEIRETVWNRTKLNHDTVEPGPAEAGSHQAS